jgi:uridine kinase
MRVIGIAGLSGSGKTALARRVAAELGSCHVLALDSYYHALPDLTLDERSRQNYDHPDSLDWELLERHLETLASGGAIEEPCYLFDRHTRGPETQRIDPAPFLIVEGILALHREAVRRSLDLAVFVHTDPEECFRRRMARDIAERGRSPESVRAQYEQSVWPMALEFVIPSRAFAHLCVSGEEPLDRSAGQVLNRVAAPRSATA